MNNEFFLGLLVGVLFSGFFFWMMGVTQILFLKERLEYWHNSAMEYLKMLKEKDKTDPADWWKGE